MTANEARRRKNPVNPKGYSQTIIHHSSMPCKNFSPYGLEKTSNINKVNCITCKRILTNKGKLR